jgi:cytochrome o ubiquinol oxidase subunit 2
MKKNTKIILFLIPIAVIIGLLVAYLNTHNIAVLEPAGQIGRKERNLFVFALALSAVVVLPVFFLTIMIAIRYREGNKRAKYTPEWDRSKLFETIWWVIPMCIIAVLSVVTWNSSHSLDPYKPIASKTSAINVEVVALDWKWLFIYPNSQVASVNQLELPLNTPVNFYITSDTVMNSFWIPNLGGQIYAMPGMTTQLHLIANKPGSYYGSSANISGQGFAGMNFKTNAVSESAFKTWVGNASQSYDHLDTNAYAALAKPTSYAPVKYYSLVQNNLFAGIINKYMMYGSSNSTNSSMNMNMGN